MTVATGESRRGDRGALRRRRLRAVQGRRRRGASSRCSRRSRSATRRCAATRASSRGCSRSARRRPATAAPTLARGDVRADGLRAPCAVSASARVARAATPGLAQALDLGAAELAPGARLEPAERESGVVRCGGGRPRAARPPRACARTWCLRPSCTRARPGAAPGGGHARGPCGRRRARPPARAAASSSGPRLALDLGHVDLVDPVAGMGEPVGELAVVGEQQHPGRVQRRAVPPARPATGESTSSTTVGLPAGIAGVVTTPAGLLSST